MAVTGVRLAVTSLRTRSWGNKVGISNGQRMQGMQKIRWFDDDGGGRWRLVIQVSFYVTNTSEGVLGEFGVVTWSIWSICVRAVKLMCEKITITACQNLGT